MALVPDVGRAFGFSIHQVTMITTAIMVTNWYLFAKSLLNLIDKNVSIEHVLTPGNQTMREKREMLPGTMTHLAGGIVKGVRS